MTPRRRGISRRSRWLELVAVATGTAVVVVALSLLRSGGVGQWAATQAAGAANTALFVVTAVALVVALVRTHQLTTETARRSEAESELAAHRAEEEREAEERRARAARIRAVVNVGEQLDIVFQPIVSLEAGRPVGYEALSRFKAEPYRPPDAWFAEAAELGMGVELELLAVRMALGHLDDLPPDTYLSLNLSPDALLSDGLIDLLAGRPGHRLVVELTEHALVADYERVNQRLAELRLLGIRLAVDDAGAGFASFRHVLQLAPDLIKLDQTITHSVDADGNRQALTGSLVRFAEETGVDIAAEGIETSEELAALRSLDVRYGQGFYLAQPGPLPARVVAS